MSLWRNSALSSKFSLQSSARTSPRGGDNHRVDLGQRRIRIHEELDEVLEKRRSLLGRVALQCQRLADLPRLEVGKPQPHVDRNPQNFFGALVSNSLDLDPSLRRSHQHRALKPAVNCHAQVQLAGDIVADRDEHFRDRAALRSRLVGHEGLAQQTGGGLLCVFSRFDELHPLGHRLGPGLLAAGDLERERPVVVRADCNPLSPPARVNLGLHHD